MNDSIEFQFAKSVIDRLSEAGFQALLAGGCVRDYLLKVAPKDYDVATNATPEQVQQVFGKKKTIAIGAAFGVITVIGTKKTGNIEVATFRKDGGYSDGRHPDSVSFCDAQEDALRRDFTVNGLFFDTHKKEVVDFVGGQKDLKEKVIRAIGNASQRFSEDRLRMLRAVRFATTLGFTIHKETLDSITTLAENIVSVSSERVAVEMAKLLLHPRRSLGLKILAETKLGRFVFKQWWGEDENWQAKSLDQLKGLAETDLTTLNPQDRLPAILVIAIWQRLKCENSSKTQELFPAKDIANSSTQVIEKIGQILWPMTQWAECQSRQWKLSNYESKMMIEIIRSLPALISAKQIPWSQLQPVLVLRSIRPALVVLKAIEVDLQQQDCVSVYCEQKLSMQENELNPAPLLTGRDLQEIGIQPGPNLGTILKTIRQRQLDEPSFDLVAAKKLALSFLDD